MHTAPHTFAAVNEIRAERRRPELHDTVRFALIRRPDIWLDKPVAFPTLADLARAIHRARRGAGLQLAAAPLRTLGHDESRSGVSVWTLDPDGDRQDFIGWAWLDGGDRRALETALFAEQPIVAIPAAA